MAILTQRRQPAEWEPHERVWIGWPSDADLWGEALSAAQAEVAGFVSAIAFPDPQDPEGRHMRGEAIDLVVSCGEARVTAEAMRYGLPDPAAVRIHDAPMGDIWLRDTGPIFVVGDDRGLFVSALRFNGWGEKYKLGSDERMAEIIAGLSGVRVRRFDDLVAEGGAIETDGEGTIITTRQCLLNQNRNPAMTEAEVEGVLRAALGAEKVIWLSEGMVGDHTDGHVDNLARFIAPGKVVCMRPYGADDPNHEILLSIRRTLESATDARGDRLEVITIPSPGRVLIDQKIAPASHMNFYIANHSLIMPSYAVLTGDEDSAQESLEILEAHVDRSHFYAIDTSSLLAGGGSLHCISQQQPKVPA